LSKVKIGLKLDIRSCIVFRWNFVYLVLLLALDSFSQQINISGVITDSATNTPIAGAIVHLFQNKMETISDPNGRYSFLGSITASKSPILHPTTQDLPKVHLNSRCISISVKEKQDAIITYFTVLGQLISTNKISLLPFENKIQLENKNPGLTILSIKLQNESFYFKVPAINKSANNIRLYSKNIREKITTSASISNITFLDTLYVSATNYYPVRMEITNSEKKSLNIICKKQISSKQMRFIPSKGVNFKRGKSYLPKGIHTVLLTYNFFIDTTEVTIADYYSLIKTTDSISIDDQNKPVTGVSWYDAILYCNARSKRDGYDTVYVYDSLKFGNYSICIDVIGLQTNYVRNGYRLPTEAEWEFACRGGTTTDYYWFRNYSSYPSTTKDSNEVDAHAWWEGNSNIFNSTDYGKHIVATKSPNPFGLFDMAGNVYEWCNDWVSLYDTIPGVFLIDPKGPDEPISNQSPYNGKVSRSGGWDRGSEPLTSCGRAYSVPYEYYHHAGLRCVRVENASN
jgi:formylglycine-generating enzyme required for sulfatase activity